MKMQIQLCIPTQIINGFCYPFARRLLDKLQELEEVGKLCENEQLSPNTKTREVAVMYANQLSLQIHGEVGQASPYTLEGTRDFISAASEFLNALADKEEERP